MLALIVASILLTADVPPPEIIVEVGSTRGVLVEAEAHPVLITITGIGTGGATVPVATCPSSPICHPNVTFRACGVVQLSGVVEYGFFSDDPYSIEVNAVVIVIGCDIFADGFEDGSASSWSLIVQ